MRCNTEMGMGGDVHGHDATRPGKCAVSDAIRHPARLFPDAWQNPNDSSSRSPSRCRTRAGSIPRQRQGAAVRHSERDGGQGRAGSAGDSGSNAIIIANAAVIVSFDDGATG